MARGRLDRRAAPPGRSGARTILPEQPASGARREGVHRPHRRQNRPRAGAAGRSAPGRVQPNHLQPGRHAPRRGFGRQSLRARLGSAGGPSAGLAELGLDWDGHSTRGGRRPIRGYRRCESPSSRRSCSPTRSKGSSAAGTNPHRPVAEPLRSRGPTHTRRDAPVGGGAHGRRTPS